MNTAEAIYELVKKLPEKEAGLVLMFAEFVQQHAKPDQDSGRSSLLSYFGILKDSPSFNEDPVAIQRQTRNSNFGEFQAVSLNTKGFKFNRDDANEEDITQ